MRTFLGLRTALLGASLFLISACATISPKPVREPVTLPTSTPTATASDTDTTNDTAPSVTMPKEWQNHNGEDYDDLFDRLRAGFALDEVQEFAIDQQFSWFQHNPEYLDRTFARAQRYLYHIVTEVEARNMPLEFALLPLVESAYEPFAYSRARAAGLWQFMPGTGARFGLKQNWWYDGRRDVIESTRAGLDYLQALHDQFGGDWLLAIAAYNVGEGGVQRAINHNRASGKPTDFWHLNLPAETRAYVPKLLALKRLMAEPERYGIELPAMPNEPYFAVIDTDSQIDLKIAAKLADTPYDDVAALNPGYNRWATDPAGPHRLLIPIEHADAFENALKGLPAADRVPYLTHAVAHHETLPMIAKQYGTSIAVISKLNDLNSARLTPGQSLKIPEVSVQLPEKVLLAASRVDRPSTDTGRVRHQVVHKVRSGETLSSIARRHRMSAGALARLNQLNPGDTLVRGQRLLIQTSSKRYPSERPAAGRVLYVVHSGDTVAAIARKFHVSVAKLNSWNGLNRRHKIRSGQRLVIYSQSNRN